MRQEPILSFSVISDKRNPQFNDLFHAIQHNLFYLFQFVFPDIEVQFVMYLQNHPAS